MVEALITREIISWAINRSNKTESDVAEKLHVDRDKVAAWISGPDYPSFSQAQNLATLLHIPFGYLYLSNPPAEDLPLPDLRVVTGKPAIKPSPIFLDILYGAMRKQEWYHEYLKNQEANGLHFVGKYALQDDRKVIAADIVDTLGINDELRKQSQNWTEFLDLFVQRIEGAGIIVLRQGFVGGNTKRTLAVDEVRGFAIVDDLAPLIFINSNDAKAANIFTLAHELAHLWIGQGGVSNPDYLLRSTEQRNIIDRQCDAIAAEVLAPSDDFVIQWRSFNNLDSNLRKLAKHYRVSPFVILRRSYELNKITRATYMKKYSELLQERHTGGGGNKETYAASILSRNSKKLTTTLLTSVAEGQITFWYAAKLLNMTVKSLLAHRDRILKMGRANARLLD